MIYSDIGIGYAPAMAGLNRLKDARKRLGLRQEDVAEKLGVEQSAVSRWETNKGLPETPTLFRLAVLVEIPIEELVVGADQAYDRWRRDLLRHAPGEASAPHPKGGSDVPASARARIQELERQVEDFKARFREVQAVTRQLFGLAIGRKDSASRRRSS